MLYLVASISHFEFNSRKHRHRLYILCTTMERKACNSAKNCQKHQRLAAEVQEAIMSNLTKLGLGEVMADRIGATSKGKSPGSGWCSHARGVISPQKITELENFLIQWGTDLEISHSVPY